MSTSDTPKSAGGRAPGSPNGLALYKPGQGSGARWASYLLLALLLFLGVRSLYATINQPGQHVWAEVPVLGALSLYKAICLFVFVLGLWLVHLVLNRPTSVDLLIDTQQELQRVTWPTGQEVKAATLVVALVTFVMGAVLFWADELIQLLLRFFF